MGVLNENHDVFKFEAQQSSLECRERSDDPTLPALSAIQAAESTLPRPDSATYLREHTTEETFKHIVNDIVPGLNGQNQSSRYYGFVTGATLPIAEWADNVVSRMDQNVQVHLPGQTVATALEDATLEMMVGLLRLGNGAWNGKTFTTGATASNILGLACGREATLGKKLGGQGSVGELGLLGACVKAGITEVQVLTSAGHSSLSKAASVVGFGRQSVKELSLSDEEPWRLDIEALEMELRKPDTISIIAISAGEVNTGRFALTGVEEWKKVREVADRYGAWIHVDGAFGIFVRALSQDEPDFRLLHKRVEGIELADSITVDGHKLLNVPYDCGMFFTKSSSTLQSIFTNPNAAYLSSGSQSSIPSPLNVGIENSRRFRALPAYAVLYNQGRTSMGSMISNMVKLSRRVAKYLQASEHYELLPDETADVNEIFMIVLFKAKDKTVNDELVERINRTRQMYVSGTAWKGEKAVRMAVSNWMVDVQRDWQVVTAILDAVAEGREFDISEV
ncbi:Fc.00g102690.m01.CDS01 [Cosmosporella sp. VM-42]